MALQCHGGNGFIEENPIARLYREAPLNSVGEGTAMDGQRTTSCFPALRCPLFMESTLQGVAYHAAHGGSFGGGTHEAHQPANVNFSG
jgi:hypothetical protein